MTTYISTCQYASIPKWECRERRFAQLCHVHVIPVFTYAYVEMDAHLHQMKNPDCHKDNFTFRHKTQSARNKVTDVVRSKKEAYQAFHRKYCAQQAPHFQVADSFGVMTIRVQDFLEDARKLVPRGLDFGLIKIVESFHEVDCVTDCRTAEVTIC